jgi:signal transduction histidine kinase
MLHSASKVPASDVTSEKPHFRVSPAVLAPLGAEQLQDPALAVLELVKNAWDADARRVAITIRTHYDTGLVAVTDDGHGMNRGEFESRWLVIGASYKRSKGTSEAGRPLIGEKGLGRLSSFALGNSLRIASARPSGGGFIANVNWEELRTAPSLEDYTVDISEAQRRRGTRVEVRQLRLQWTSAHTDFLVTHAEFLASVPGESFRVALRVDGKRHPLQQPTATVARLAEATLDIDVVAGGRPRINSCVINGVDETNIQFREMKENERDPRLVGMRLSMNFFRRDEAAKRLSDVLARNEVTNVLERYQGIRIYRDGLNVPPYGLSGDDWAGLEKQRTATGGPTLVPGNSQLIGELHLSRDAHPHLVVTAGRAGFADQASVSSIANYVRWAVRELGTARRAHQMGISTAEAPVPTRVDSIKSTDHLGPENRARQALATVSKTPVVRSNPELRRTLEEASKAVGTAFDQSDQTLRLYAQLASTGIAATSFAHELRTDFDVISEVVDELRRARQKPDKELVKLLGDSWNRIKAFAALFKVTPVKLRRQPKVMSSADLSASLKTILGLAPPDKVAIDVLVPSINVTIVPAEFDSIILNLVSNAVKAIDASHNREQGRIRAALAARGSNLHISIADNGCGITPGVASVMFEPLEGRFSEGTGMGMPIVKFIAERYKGNVSLNETPPEGYATEVIVNLRNVIK